MKKLILIVFTTVPLFGEPFFCPIKAKSEVISDFKENKTNTEVKYGFDFNMNFDSFLTQGCFYGEGKITKNEKYLLENIRYGISTRFVNSPVDFLIKAGTLNYSKSISVLKNPVPYVPTIPYTKNFSFNSGISALLPDISSSNQQLSTFSQICFQNKKTKLHFQGAITQDKNITAGGVFKFNFNRISFLQTSITGGRFYLENSSSYLKKHNADFSKTPYMAFLMENYLSLPHFKAVFSTGLHETPFSGKSVWISSKFRTGYNSFILDASFFFIPTSKYSPFACPLISASSSVIKTMEQFYINPQYVFLLDSHSSLRIGILAMENAKVCGTNSLTTINTAKINIGADYKTKTSSSKLSVTAANLILKGSPPNKTSTPDTWYGTYFSISKSFSFFFLKFTENYKYYPPKVNADCIKQNIITGSGFKFDKMKDFYFSNSWNVILKGNEITENTLDLSLQYKYSKKYLNASFKFSINLGFTD